VQLYPKNQLSINDTYVDVRHWTVRDETLHPALYARLQQLQQTSVLDAAPVESDEEAAPVTTASLGSVSPAWIKATRGLYGPRH
jgi:hypothetical protein